MIKFYLSFIATLMVITSLAQSNRTTVTVSLTPSLDNTIFQSPPNNSNALGGYFIAGQTNGGSIRRALIKFNLSSIPAGSVITNVSLQLTLNKTIAGPIPVRLHKMSADWEKALQMRAPIPQVLTVPVAAPPQEILPGQEEFIIQSTGELQVAIFPELFRQSVR